MDEWIKKEVKIRQGDELQINWEKTREIEQQEKYVRFNKWCTDNGVLRGATRYPVAFGDEGQLVGIGATKDIALREAFVYVPQALMICESKFRADPEIGHLIDKHPTLFKEKLNKEHVILMFFLVHEFSKGEDSFWYAYFQVAAIPDLLGTWDPSDLDELHDPLLREESIDEMEEMREEYEEVLEVAHANADCLKVEAFTFENYVKAHYHVSTRCFGYAIPELSLVPYADMANHHTTDNCYEMFNIRLATNLRNNPESVDESDKHYATTERKKIDYLTNLPEETKQDNNLPLVTAPRALPRESQKYARKVERRHGVLSITPTHLLEHPELVDKDIWELGYCSTSDEDDYDEDEEDDSEEDEDEEESSEAENEEEETKEGPKVDQSAPLVKVPTASSSEAATETSTEATSFSQADEQTTAKAVKDESTDNAAAKRSGAAPKPEKSFADEVGKDTAKPDNNQVPDFAKRLVKNGLLKGKKRAPHVRYVYRVGENGEVIKTAIIRKTSQKAPPIDLVQFLIEKKYQMYDKEIKQQQIKELDDLKIRESVAEYQSSEENEYDLEENFSWYKDPDTANYFVLSTVQKNMIAKDSQIFICYGRRSNRYLLTGYGFQLATNKYNALTFRVQLDFRHKDKKAAAATAEEEDWDEDNNCISKVLKFKKNRIKEDLLAYIRISLVEKSERQEGKKVKENILISTPVDVEFEMLTLACAIQLFDSMLEKRFKGMTVEQDKAELAKPNLSARKITAIHHRMACKDILTSTKTLCYITMEILARMQLKFDSGQTEFTKAECKSIYMERVDRLEGDASEVMLNRLRIRKYIRELILNQQRVAEKIANLKGQDAQVQDIIGHLKKEDKVVVPEV